MRTAVPPHPLVKEWIAAIQYEADVLALYQQQQLVYDDFNKDGLCRWRLNAADLQGKGTRLQLLPVPPQADIYVEDSMLESRNRQWNTPRISRINLTPVYQYTLTIP